MVEVEDVSYNCVGSYVGEFPRLALRKTRECVDLWVVENIVSEWSCYSGSIFFEWESTGYLISVFETIPLLKH